MSVATISPAQLSQQKKAGQKIDLIDVRTPVEFREVHVDGRSQHPARYA